MQVAAAVPEWECTEGWGLQMEEDWFSMLFLGCLVYQSPLALASS
jgi:hypothetical protein